MKTQAVRTIELEGDQAWSLGGGQRLRVLSGAAWLTHEGELDDRVVAAGAEVALGDGNTVVQARGGPVRLQLVEAAAPWTALGQRLRHALRRQIERWQLGPAAPLPCH